MDKTKIEWTDATWNPVTGCLHGCEYCYARGITKRYGPKCEDEKVHDLKVPIRNAVMMKSGACQDRIVAYPFGFAPTFHRYRLDVPTRWKKPRTIFVGSMCDLFGEWVSDGWIKVVFEACAAAPWHNYLFLTKNPGRLDVLQYNNELPVAPNYWYGSSVTKNDVLPFYSSKLYNAFISIEPLLEPIDNWIPSIIQARWVKWAIIGAMTGPGSKQHQPKAEWVADIVTQCKIAGVPVFMKDSLIPIIGENNMLRQWPQGLGA